MFINRVRTSLRALLAVAVMGGLTLSANAAELTEQWLEDFDAAKVKAEETDKPILAVFSAVWCGPCQEMKKNVYPQEQVIEALNDWVPVYIDTDANQELAQKYEVQGIPTYVVMNSEAEELGRFVGSRPTADAFLDQINNTLKFKDEHDALTAKIEASPEDAALYIERAELNEANDRQEEAIEDYKMAQKHDTEGKFDVADDVAFFGLEENVATPDDMVAKLKSFSEEYPESNRMGEVEFMLAMSPLWKNELQAGHDSLKKFVEENPENENADYAKSVIEQVATMLAEQEKQEAEGETAETSDASAAE